MSAKLRRAFVGTGVEADRAEKKGMECCTCATQEQALDLAPALPLRPSQDETAHSFADCAYASPKSVNYDRDQTSDGKV